MRSHILHKGSKFISKYITNEMFKLIYIYIYMLVCKNIALEIVAFT